MSLQQIKRCRVCGDEATGFNFQGHVSCDSCKAFFRRNALKDDQLRCRQAFEGKCTINWMTRKKCRSCRLAKCFAIGMKKEQIKVSNQITDITSSPTTALKAYEHYRLQEVQNAISVFRDEESLQVIHKRHTPSQILNIPGAYVYETIKFCKRIPAFSSLPPSDQLIMLKCFFPEKNSVRISYKYDQELDGWTGMEDENGLNLVVVKLDDIRSWSRKELVDIFECFISKMHDEMEDDIMIRNLILVILLFKPRPSLSVPEYIRYHHLVYCHLLRRYLEHKYADRCAAERKYTSLGGLLRKIDYIAALIRQLYFEAPQSTVIVEALIEIYNL